MKFRGVSAKVNFALDGLPVFPALPGHRRTTSAASSTSVRRSSTSSGPSTPRSTAGTASGPSSTPRSSRSSTPTWPRRASTCMSCFVQYAPYELAGSDWETEREQVRRQGPGGARGALPRLRRPGAAPRGRHPGRHRAHAPGSRRATSSPASSSPRRCTSSGRPRAGASTPPRSTATTSAAPAPTPAAASSARPAGSPASGSSATAAGRADRVGAARHPLTNRPVRRRRRYGVPLHATAAPRHRGDPRPRGRPHLPRRVLRRRRARPSARRSSPPG